MATDFARVADRIWTDADKDRVVELWEAGDPVALIAQKMGVGKNAISGLADRLKKAGRIAGRSHMLFTPTYNVPTREQWRKRKSLAKNPRTPKLKPDRDAQKEGAASVRIAKERTRHMQTAKAEIVVAPPVPPEPPKLSRRAHCQWIHNNDRPWLYCDRPAVVMPGGIDAWCVECYARVYAPYTKAAA